MSMTRLTVTVDDDVLAELKQRAPKGEVSAFVLEAIREKLRIDPVMKLLQTLDEMYGPLTDTELDEARLWGQDVTLKMEAARRAIEAEEQTGPSEW